MSANQQESRLDESRLGESEDEYTMRAEEVQKRFDEAQLRWDQERADLINAHRAERTELMNTFQEAQLRWDQEGTELTNTFQEAQLRWDQERTELTNAHPQNTITLATALIATLVVALGIALFLIIRLSDH